MANPELNQLVEQLSKAFDQCLDNALSDPMTRATEDKGTSDITCLKSTILDLEYQLNGIRLECMQDKSLSVTESITLLKRDIDIKQTTIEKYMDQMNNWMKILPKLEQKSLDILNAPSVTTTVTATTDTATSTKESDGNADATSSSLNRTTQDIEHIGGDDDDDDEDVEFEEV
ncbi:hypothetical protein BCR42DRAFT_403751 [Absidia repens]|uniref:Uncharacterized protein n=1 Tax=Absidia repens TaxID=90262 RepID=A0A1X2IVA7_9FUNG|nr:hypothetical protein BCR42DRAFT_403751 [Absidia repens]